MARRARNIEAWSASEGADLDAIVINASGCGTTVKDYGFMFRIGTGTLADAGGEDRRPDAGHHPVPDPLRLRADARGTRADGRLPLRVQPATRPAGHGRTEDAAVPRRLPGGRTDGAASLLRLGRHLQPAAAGDRRAPARAQAGQPAGDEAGPGRRRQYRLHHPVAGGGLPVVHTVELLDWMAGGPRPPGVPG